MSNRSNRSGARIRYKELERMCTGFIKSTMAKISFKDDTLTVLSEMDASAGILLAYTLATRCSGTQKHDRTMLTVIRLKSV